MDYFVATGMLCLTLTFWLERPGFTDAVGIETLPGAIFFYYKFTPSFTPRVPETIILADFMTMTRMALNR